MTTRDVAEISELLAESSYRFYPAYGTKAPIPGSGLFHYHLPRTGGTTFNTALTTSLGFACETYGLKAYCGRILSREDEIYLTDKEINFGRHGFSDRACMYVQVEHSYGMHRTFRQTFDLTTFVRDPATQLPSFYNYRSRFDGQAPTEKGFEEFLQRPENQNRTVRILSGDGMAADTGSIDKAIAALTDSFMIFGLPEMVDDTISWALSRYGGPNFIGPAMNRNHPEFCLPDKDYGDVVRESCPMDVQLFEWIAANQRPPDFSRWKENGIASVVMITDEHIPEDGGAASGYSCPVATDELIERLRRDPDFARSGRMAETLFHEKSKTGSGPE